MTYQQIADEFGVSRQRVHQKYRDYKPTDQTILKKVYALHGRQCVICGKTKNIEVHHMDGVKTNNDLSNLTPLCRKHHRECEIEERKKLGLHKHEPHLGGGERVARTERKCLRCNTPFLVLPRKRKAYCSLECFNATRPKLDPEEKKRRHSIQVKRWTEKNKEKMREWNKIYLKEYYKRPEVQQKIKLRFENMLSDPILHAKYLERARIANKRKWEKIRSNPELLAKFRAKQNLRYRIKAEKQRKVINRVGTGQ